MNELKQKKLTAFTLVEISITMLLSLIVVGMMYMALHIIAHELEQPDDAKMEKIALFKVAIGHAFFEASEIEYSDEKKMLVCRDSGQVRRFLMEEALVLMLLPEVEPDTVWNGGYSFGVTKGEDTLVDDIYYDFPLRSDTLSVQISKHYSATTLLNHKTISFEY